MFTVFLFDQGLGWVLHYRCNYWLQLVLGFASEISGRLMFGMHSLQQVELFGLVIKLLQNGT